jgi:TRAP-type C4-dicarboxylate transport system permease small subunit
MRAIETIAVRIVALSNGLAAVLVLMIFSAMAVQVVSRYVFNSSVFWADDVAIWGMAWLVMLACVGLCFQWKHIHVPALVNALPAGIREWFIMLSRALTLGLLIALVWYGFDVVSGSFHRVTPGLGWSTRWFKLAIPFCALLSAIVVAARLMTDFSAWRRGDRAHFASYGSSGSVD